MISEYPGSVATLRYNHHSTQDLQTSHKRNITLSLSVCVCV